MKKPVQQEPSTPARRPISDADMDGLLTPQERKLLQGADKGFRYRHIFLTVAMLTLIIRLVFFSATVGDSFNVQPGMHDLATYFQYRGLYVLLASAVYVLSYVRDWYFERVAMVILTMAIFGWAVDLFSVYGLMKDPTSPSAILFFVLRLAIIACLFMNAIRAKRAPLAPRGFWS
jgi:hypothetical protein